METPGSSGIAGAALDPNQPDTKTNTPNETIPTPFTPSSFKPLRRFNYQKLKPEEDLALIRLCVENKSLFRHGSKTVFWKKIQTQLAQKFGHSFSPVDRHVMGMVRKHRMGRLKMSQEYIEYLEKWHQWQENNIGGKNACDEEGDASRVESLSDIRDERTLDPSMAPRASKRQKRSNVGIQETPAANGTHAAVAHVQDRSADGIVKSHDKNDHKESTNPNGRATFMATNSTTSFAPLQNRSADSITQTQDASVHEELMTANGRATVMATNSAPSFVRLQNRSASGMMQTLNKNDHEESTNANGRATLMATNDTPPFARLQNRSAHDKSVHEEPPTANGRATLMATNGTPSFARLRNQPADVIIGAQDKNAHEEPTDADGRATVTEKPMANADNARADGAPDGGEWPDSSASADGDTLADQLDKALENFTSQLRKSGAPGPAGNSSLLLAVISLVRDNRNRILDLDDDIRKEQKKRKWNDDIVWSMVKNKCAELDLDYNERFRHAPLTELDLLRFPVIQDLHKTVDKLTSICEEQQTAILDMSTMCNKKLPKILNILENGADNRGKLTNGEAEKGNTASCRTRSQMTNGHGSQSQDSSELKPVQSSVEERLRLLMKERDADARRLEIQESMLLKMDKRINELEGRLAKAIETQG